MTTTTPDLEAKLTPAEALAAAEAACEAADAAVVAANDGTTAAQKTLADIEAEAIEAMAAAATTGDSAPARQRIDKVRARLDKGRADVDWAHLQQHAAEVARNRAVDEAAHARRRVTEDEYLNELKRLNAPAERESVLRSQLTENVAELAQLIEGRYLLHDRLAHNVESWPDAEKVALQQRIMQEMQSHKVEGKAIQPITTHGTRGSWMVNLPKLELTDAIKAGLTEAENKAKARAQAAAQGQG